MNYYVDEFWWILIIDPTGLRTRFSGAKRRALRNGCSAFEKKKKNNGGSLIWDNLIQKIHQNIKY